MNIYYFGISAIKGGIENFAYNLIRGIRSVDTNINFTLLVFKDYFFKREEFLNELNCNYILLPNFYKHPFRFYKSLLDLNNSIKDNDLIQLNVCSYRNYLLFKAVSKLNCRKIVVSHYSKVNGAFAFAHHINRYIFKDKFHNVACSEIAGKFMFKSKFEIIHNGVCSSKFSYNVINRTKIRSMYNITDDVFLLAQVGRISEEKNNAFSTNLLEEVTKYHPKVKLVLIGDDFDNKLPILLKKSKHVNDIIYIPSVDNIGDYYSAFDCLLLPSKNDAFSLVLYEGLSNGVPILYSTNIPKVNLTPLRSNLNLYQLPLDIKLWSSYILFISKLENIQRNNNIMGTEFELDSFIKKYHDLYRDFN